MTQEVKSILDKLLVQDLTVSAQALGFQSRVSKSISYDDVCEAISVLNELSLDSSDSAKTVFIAISALLWEYGSSEYTGLKDILIRLLARVGYAPSSIILDPTYNTDGKFAPFTSLLSQWQADLNFRAYEVIVHNKTFLLTDFQRRIWQTIKNQRLSGISAPTSAGKSFVLMLEAAQELIENNHDIIYIVPTLSLVNQVSEDFIRLFKQLDWNNYEILNSYNKELVSDTIPQIFIVTQERAISAFTMTDKPFIWNSMLIIDEIQNIERINSEGSEARSKILLDAVYEFRFLDSITKIVISGPRINDIGKLGKQLFGEDEYATVETDVSPVLSITYGIESVGEKYHFKQYCSFTNDIHYLPISSASKIVGHGKKRYNDEFISYLVDFINRLGPNVQNIIFSPTANQARNTALALADSLSTDENLLSLSQYLKETVHDNYALANTVAAGVAYHHGKMPMHARKVIEYAMSQKQLSNIACTTTLMQGINMPAQNVIIRNPHLYIQRRSDSAELSSYEMANLRGRAGRLLKDFIGRTYVLDENEFLEVTDEYQQESLFEDTYKELDSSYKKTYETNEPEIETALIDEISSNQISKEYRFLVVHIRQTILRHGKSADQRLRAVGITLPKPVYQFVVESINALDIPKEICIKNRYWDPLVLNSLFLEKDLPTVPVAINDTQASAKLRTLLKYLRDNSQYTDFFNERVRNGYRKGATLAILCDTAVKWAKEKPLKDILVGDYYDNPDNIESTILLLQNTISYDLPVLLRPIYDIQKREATFLTFLESGAFQPLTRKLIEIGIPRETAIFLFQEVLLDLPTDCVDLYATIKKQITQKKHVLPLWVKPQISFLL